MTWASSPCAVASGESTVVCGWWWRWCSSLLVSFPFWAGALGARLAQAALAQRLGVGVYVGQGAGGLTALTLYGVRIADGDARRWR